jgi:hypothetical protein
LAVFSTNSRRCDGVSKCGLIAANEIMQLVSASMVSPVLAIHIGVGDERGLRDRGNDFFNEAAAEVVAV